jgi:hypothetical protein
MTWWHRFPGEDDSRSGLEEMYEIHTAEDLQKRRSAIETIESREPEEQRSIRRARGEKKVRGNMERA